MAQSTSLPSHHPRQRWLACAAAFALLVSTLACTVLAPSKTATREAIPNPEALATDDTSAIPPAAGVPTPLDEPTATGLQAADAETLFLGPEDSSASAKPLEVAGQWAGLDKTWEDSAGLVIVVRNPNTNLGYSIGGFSLVVHDKAGNPIGDPIGGVLNMIMPGQTVAFYQTFQNPNKAEIGSMDVQFQPETSRKAGAQSFPLSVDQVKLVEKNDAFSVTGFVKNTFDRDIAYVTLVAVGYDENGKVVNGGGGYSIDFIPGNGQATVDIRLNGKEKPARVELYPSLSPYAPVEPPSDELKDIHISGLAVEMGGNYSADYTAILENTSSSKVYLEVQYNFAIYAEDGSVLAAQSSRSQNLFPNGKIAITGTMTLPADARISRADVQFNYPESIERDDPDNRALQLKSNPLTASPEVAISEDDYYYNFTGTVSNALDEAIQYADVVAVAYDNQGKMIGSGTGSVDLPARGQAQVKVNYMRRASNKPARVVLFPALPSSWGHS